MPLNQSPWLSQSLRMNIHFATELADLGCFLSYPARTAISDLQNSADPMGCTVVELSRAGNILLRRSIRRGSCEYAARRHYWEHIAARVLLTTKCAQYGTVQRKRTRLAGCLPSARLIHISHTKAYCLVPLQPTLLLTTTQYVLISGSLSRSKCTQRTAVHLALQSRQP